MSADDGGAGAAAPKQESRRRRWIRRAALGVLAVSSLSCSVVLAQAWVPIGSGASGHRLERMTASPQWREGVFENPQPLLDDPWLMFTEGLSASDYGTPAQPLPVVQDAVAQLAAPPGTGLRATWLGHSSVLIEIDGLRILTDPVWGERTAPISWAGPSRWYPPPIALDELPAVDAVIISHDHYDHLDQPTIAAIATWDTRFITPLGVGAHLEYWGVPSERITELDWWERTQIDGQRGGQSGGRIELACVPARHASGRQLFDRNATLWAGYALLGPAHRVYFSGDTGLFPAMREIGEQFGPFDLTMIEVGAYGQAWPDWHMGPEQAVRAHEWMRGRVLLPIHWGLFNLAYHGWTEPIERTVVAAEAAGVVLATPRPGQSIEPEALGERERWWPEVAWRTADAYPIVSTEVD